jgi:hypothetical protein
MNFEDESYVRLYTRKTITSKRLGWEGRTVLWHLMCEADRAGIIEVGDGELGEALTVLLDLPEELIRTAIPRLESQGVTIRHGSRLLIVRFQEAQEAKRSDAVRAKEYRDRRRHEITSSRDGASQSVTERHDEPSGVMPRHESSLSAVLPLPPLPPVLETAQVREPAPPPPPPVKVADHQITAKTPRSPAEALEMPITERAAYTVQNRHLAEWFMPESWPEVIAVAQAVHDANGLAGKARLLPYASDSGVRAVVALFGAGYSLDELLAAVRGVTKTKWWRGGEDGKPRSLGALSVEVIRREQAGARETQLTPEQRARIDRAKQGLKPDPRRAGAAGPALLAAVLPTLPAASGGES